MLVGTLEVMRIIDFFCLFLLEFAVEKTFKTDRSQNAVLHSKSYILLHISYFKE